MSYKLVTVLSHETTAPSAGCGVWSGARTGCAHRRTESQKLPHRCNYSVTELSEADLIKEFTQQKLNLRQGFVSTGMGDLQSKILTLKEAKKRKADIGLQSRKQQKLLQAEQPRLIKCAA